MARKYGVTAPSDVKRVVSRLVNEHGIGDAARLLGVGVESVGRIASGGAVLRATLEVVQSRLPEPVGEVT